MNETIFAAPPRRVPIWTTGRRTIILAAGALCLLTACFLNTAAAQASGLTIIRDTEIEKNLRRWSEPVIEAAELDPQAINFILIQDSNINAFVAGGQNVFIYTGLIEKSDTPDELIGVIAHELGHIRGGHLIRGRDAMENASYEALLGTILGLGAAILTGSGDLASAVSAGSSASAMGRYLAFSRVQESSADQAALTYLSRAQMNPQGLMNFMQKLESQELLPVTQQTEYVRTHPLARNRVDSLKAGYERSAWKDKAVPASWLEEHARTKAKLVGFIRPERVDWDYESKDASIAADYARAIAAYRQNRVDEALKRIDALIAREPNNPYFIELKGQMLVDFGRVAEALPAYRRAIELDGQAPLIRIAYAHALIESSARQPQQLDDAITQLNRAQRDEWRSPRVFRLLATAHGRKGDEAMAKLYLAEEAVLKQDYDYAKRQAELALQSLKQGSQPWIRARDLLSVIEQNKKKD